MKKINTIAKVTVVLSSTFLLTWCPEIVSATSENSEKAANSSVPFSMMDKINVIKKEEPKKEEDASAIAPPLTQEATQTEGEAIKIELKQNQPVATQKPTEKFTPTPLASPEAGKAKEVNLKSKQMISIPLELPKDKKEEPPKLEGKIEPVETILLADAQELNQEIIQEMIRKKQESSNRVMEDLKEIKEEIKEEIRETKVEINKTALAHSEKFEILPVIDTVKIDSPVLTEIAAVSEVLLPVMPIEKQVKIIAPVVEETPVYAPSLPPMLRVAGEKEILRSDALEMALEAPKIKKKQDESINPVETLIPITSVPEPQVENEKLEMMSMKKIEAKAVVKKPEKIAVAKDENESIFNSLFHEKIEINTGPQFKSNTPELDKLDEQPRTLSLKQSRKNNEENDAAADAPLVAIFEKRDSNLNLEEQVVVDYHRALELISGGDVLQAERVLENILIKVPSYKGVRVELAKIYLKFDRDSDAEALIKKGLVSAKDYPEFLKLMAIIYERKGIPDLALEFLNKIPDNLKHDMNTAAFVGQIYQQTGRFKLAQRQYVHLLQREPGNPMWLLGVTIALDSEGKKKEALEGYRRLLKEATLEMGIVKYIETRIANLKG